MLAYSVSDRERISPGQNEALQRQLAKIEDVLILHILKRRRVSELAEWHLGMRQWSAVSQLRRVNSVMAIVVRSLVPFLQPCHPSVGTADSRSVVHVRPAIAWSTTSTNATE